MEAEATIESTTEGTRAPPNYMRRIEQLRRAAARAASKV